MTRRRTVGALAAVLALGYASSAQASSIVYVCAPNLCRIDPAHPKKVTRLTRDGKAGGPVYLSPSLSTKGTKLSFVKGNRLYLAQGNATHARRVDEPVGTAVTRMRPEGRRWPTSAASTPSSRPGYVYPYYSPPVYGFVPFLFTRPASGAKGQTVARSTTSTGWLRDQVLLPYPVPGEGARPEGICVAAPPGPTRCARGWSRSTRSRARSPTPPRHPTGATSSAVAEPWVDSSQLHPHLPRRDRAVRPGDGRVRARPDHRARRRHPGLLARRQAGRLHARRGPLRRRRRRWPAPSCCATACGSRRGARASRR